MEEHLTVKDIKISQQWKHTDPWPHEGKRPGLEEKHCIGIVAVESQLTAYPLLGL